jgi:hypothetical protein
MPFYKCYGCMKTFYSETRIATCKYCHKLLSESLNRAPNPPRLRRTQSSPQLGALTPEQQVRLTEHTNYRPRYTPECPTALCMSQVSLQWKDTSGKSRNGNVYGCALCQALFIWDPEIQFDVQFTFKDVADKMHSLNMLGFRCLGLETGLVAVNTIFDIGFKPKGEENLTYRTNVHAPIITSFDDDIQTFPKSGDILPDSGHCFSRSLPGCTTFPNDTSKTIGYLFICYLRYGFNTNAQQCKDVRTILSYYPGLSEYEEEVAWPLHALEVAVDSVEPEDILACIPCTKVWKSKKWEDGGTYVLELDRILYAKTLPMAGRVTIYNLCSKYAKGEIPKTNL